jgi:hypothetical protein
MNVKKNCCTDTTEQKAKQGGKDRYMNFPLYWQCHSQSPSCATVLGSGEPSLAHEQPHKQDDHNYDSDFVNGIHGKP